MARALPGQCGYPDCPNLTHGRFCPEHRSLARDDRPTAQRRGYDAAWKRLRAAHVAANPWCVDPYGRHPDRRVPVAIVDHVVTVREDPSRRLDPTNLQSLCRSCNAVKTAEDVRRMRGDT